MIYRSMAINAEAEEDHLAQKSTSTQAYTLGGAGGVEPNLREVVDVLGQGILVVDGDLCFLMANSSYWKLVFPPEHPKADRGTPFVELLRQIYNGEQLALPEGTAFDAFADDAIAWLRDCGPNRSYTLRDGRVASLKVVRTEQGGYLILITDVTAEQDVDLRARDMLMESFQSLDTGMVLCDSDMRFVFANDAWYKMHFDGSDVAPPLAGENALESLIKLMKSGYYAVPEGMTGDEFVVWLMGEMSQFGKQVPYRLADGRHMVGSSHQTSFGGALLIVRDVTDIKESEQRALDVLEDGLQALNNGIAIYDENARFVFGNDKLSEIWYQNMEPMRPGEHLKDAARRCVDEGAFDLPEGVTAEEFAQEVYNASTTYQKNVVMSVNGRTISGNSHRTKLGGYMIEFYDVTEQLKAERELAEMREIAHQNEKLSALGELLAGVAHELNNPLSVVFGYSQMLQGKIDDPVLAERVDFICQSAERAAKIVKTFLAMARQRPTKIENCSINEVVNTALEVSSYSLKSNGTVVITEFDEDAPMVAGDFDQLAQVFSNLIINAGHAVQDKREAGEIHVRSFFDTRKNETVVEVRDNGPGIPRDLQRRIFEPFFTTKEVGEGTGVGLAFSHRIVQSHDGLLDLHSTLGEGTSFFVRLSAATKDAFKDQNVLPHTPVRGVRRLLVVDDEVGVARLIRDVLSEDGFDVTTTTSPREALRLAKDQSFDVILSDYKMPDMDGQAFYNAMRQVAPAAADRIGFVTGDAMSQNVADFLNKSGRPHIEKPIIKHELMTLLRRATDRKES
ncbi:PAS-domain containing protein [Yoonia sp. GPGPB17]|uniref:PAS-domain containing protein n=1 Tax=Yoonia sp. GPGPB17 TaxID=3026147 RepID=UPI0030BD2E60